MILSKLAGQGAKRKPEGWPAVIIRVLSVATALYLIFAVLYYPEPILHRSITFGLFYSLIFLGYVTPGGKSVARIPVHDWLLAFLSLGVSVYIGLNIGRLTTRMVFYDPVLPMDMIFGALTLVLLFEGTRRVIGPWLPGLSLLALAYIFSGHLIPGRFGHRPFGAEYIVDGLFMTNYGVWGSVLGIAAGPIMIFLLFGTVFIETGAGGFLFDFVSRIAGKSRGGIAKVAIITSAMFGMVSGGSLANVTTTGAMTIPAMKKSGFSGEYAAGIESCASVGGIFMPPIMGSVAFIMSDVVGIPYAEIIQRAVLPAIIYFSALFFAVDIRSRRLGIKGAASQSKERIMPLLLKGYNFFIPLAYLVFRLISGRTSAAAGLETILLMLALSLFDKRKPFSFKMIIDSLASTAGKGTLIVSTMAMCGILVGVIDITGITAKFTSYLTHVSDISIILTLIVVMLVTIFLGLAMSITSTYLIVAVLGAPVLVSLGFEPLAVHMFILFFAAMATITPPVAITAYAAAAIAEVSPMKVGFLSMKAGMVAYILPFAFIATPALLLYGSFPEVAISFFIALAGTF
ncbi:MAG: TRAP transporter fused permease subunit, partial [Clostridia bacterium]|nr:TRAP transporter fused permease subunit [Clostridia bacterium]